MRFHSLFKAGFAGLGLIVLLTAEQVSAEPVKVENHHHQAQNSLDWPGIYNGFLPCADCVGIKTSLALNKNGSYVLIRQYAGKSPREFVEKGKFTWTDKANTITLTARDGSNSQQYFVAENQLIQLDAKGERVTGQLAERYVLRRMDVTGSAPSNHGGH